MGIDLNNLPNFEFSRALKDSLGIFIVLMLVFTIFSHTIGDNENSRLDTTISIVEDGTFSIDRIHNNTGDKSFINGTYYSDKAPLPSFLAVPGYALVSMKFNESLENKSYSESFRRSHSQKMEWARFVSTVSVSALAGALTSVICYLFSINLGLKRKESIFVGFLSGLSTLVFPYSTTFHGTMLGTFFLISASYLWFKEDYNASRKTTGLIALLIGLGVASSYLIVIPGGILLSLNSIDRLEQIKLHLSGLAGLFLGLLPLFTFNMFTTGNPFDLTTFHSIDPFPNRAIEGYLIETSFNGLKFARGIRALISPLNGLFLYSPVLLFGLIGLRKLYSDKKKLSIYISSSFVLTLILTSLIPLWPVRAFFGPRYLLPVSMLLVIPLIYEFKDSDRFERALIYFSGIFSSIVMFSSTQPWKGISWIYPRGVHAVEMTSLKIYDNRLGEYIMNLPSEGLQSPIISYLKGASSNFHMVLSSYPQYTFPVNIFDSIFVLDIRFLSLIVIIAATFFVIRGILEFNDIKLYSLLGLIFIFIFLGVSIQSDYRHDWYDERNNETLQWGREEPDLYFKSNEAQPRIITLEARSLEKQEYRFYHNGDFVSKRNISSQLSNISEIIKPEKGLNRISFRTDECAMIGEVTGNNDVRCVTLGLNNYEVGVLEDDLLFDNLNQESPENKVLGDNSRVLIGNTSGKKSLVMEVVSNETTEISAEKDGERLFSSRIDSFPTLIKTPYFNSEKLEWIEFEKTCDFCEVRLQKVELMDEKEENSRVRKSTGWYREVESENITWSTGNSTLLLYNSQNRTVSKSLTLTGRAFGEIKNIGIRLNGKDITDIEMPTTFYRILENGTRTSNSHTVNLELMPGENKLSLNAKDCTVIGEVIGNNDVRCAAYGFSEIILDN